MIIQVKNTVLEQAARAAYSAVKEACPVRTGALRESITLNISGSRAVISAGKNYGIYVELGTENVPPKPFMSVGIEAAERRLKQIKLSEFIHINAMKGGTRNDRH